MEILIEDQPTFEAEVMIPLPGKLRETTIEFVFHWFGNRELDALIAAPAAAEASTGDAAVPAGDASPKARSVAEMVPIVVAGWHREGVPFSAAALDRLLDKCPAAIGLIWERYISERSGAPRKN